MTDNPTPQRRRGRTKLVYDKALHKIVPVPNYPVEETSPQRVSAEERLSAAAQHCDHILNGRPCTQCTLEVICDAEWQARAGGVKEGEARTLATVIQWGVEWGLKHSGVPREEWPQSWDAGFPGLKAQALIEALIADELKPASDSLNELLRRARLDELAWAEGRDIAQITARRVELEREAEKEGGEG